VAGRARLEDVLTRHQVFVQRLSAGQVGKFDPFLKRVIADIREQLGDEELTKFGRRRLEDLLEAVERAIDVPLGQFRRQLRLELQDFGEHEAQFSARALGGAGVNFESVIPSASQIRAAVLSAPLAAKGPDGGMLLADFISDWTAGESRSVTGAIRLGVFQGQTNAEIVRRIIGTRAMKFADGLLSVTRRNATVVVHTAVQHVSTVARLATFAANEGVIAQVRWISTLDARACPRCMGLDRQVFPLNKGPRPPLHPRCRCTLIAVLKAEFAALQEGGTRASAGADGGKQVTAGLSYFEWLMKQPAGFQDAALGPMRARLLRDGGLSAARFAQLQLDKNFAPMTLDQMRALEPLAFEHAGL
jgi:SPP1 gp7 family putative phage head morphogenesis protein